MGYVSTTPCVERSRNIDTRVHQGDLWGRAGSLIPRLRSAQGLFVCDKLIGEPAPTGDKPIRIWSDLPKKNLKFKIKILALFLIFH